jgi:hypothetical protein
MFPLESVLLPGAQLPLHVFEERYRMMIRECLGSDRLFGVVLIERGREVGGGDVRSQFGATAYIEADAGLGDGRYALMCRGQRRLKVLEWLPDDPYPHATVEIFDESDGSPADDAVASAEASVRRAWALLSELGASSPPSLNGAEQGDPAWLWCSLAPLTPVDQLALLKVGSVDERLALLVGLSDAVTADARRLLSENAG